MATPRLHFAHTALLVIDLQAKLVPLMADADHLLAQAGRLIDGFKALGLPVLVTEQYPKGLGPTVPAILDRLPAGTVRHEKTRFSACVDPVVAELQRLGARCVLVCGIEAHVCVLQTCLDLRDAGHLAFLAGDAVSSRRPADREAAERRMAQAGVVPSTVESALLELVREAGTDRFKAVLPLIR